MSKTVTITRKIQLNVVGSKEEINVGWNKIREWGDVVFRAANYVASHAFYQEKINEFSYFTEDFQVILKDQSRFPEGCLVTSKDNTTYRLLSDKFKGEIPAAIFSAVNMQVRKQVQAERVDLFSGKKSLRSYKRGMPIPIPKPLIRNFFKDNEDKGNYSFEISNIKLKTYFGKDLSDNESMIDRSTIGEYKLCDSSIQIQGNKMFWLAVIQFEPKKNDLKPEKTLIAKLGIDHPIQFTNGKHTYNIGTKEEFLHRRMQIQSALRNLQIASRFSKGGKGRKKKLEALDRFEKLEYNYVTTRIHQYTAKLIDECVKAKCGTLILQVNKDLEQDIKDNPLVLRQWSYFGMKDKLAYKCNANGIVLKEMEI